MTTESARTNRWFRTNLWLHRWTSLVATPFFLILCLTGTVLIFHEEIDHALGYTPEVHVVGGERKSMDELVRIVQAAHPDKRVMLTFWDETDHPGLMGLNIAPAASTETADSRTIWVDSARGTIIEDVPDDEESVTHFLLELHAQWFLGPLGEIFGALIALLVLISLFSGIVVYAPYVKRIAFGVIRGGGTLGSRLRQLDLHNFIGVVVLGWMLAVSLTGFALGFGTLALGIWQMTDLSEMSKSFDGDKPLDLMGPLASADKAVEMAQATRQDWIPNMVFWPCTDFSSPRHYTILFRGPSGLDERLLYVGFVDAESGKLALATEVPWYLKAILLSQPLHFGDYGGMPLKILWTVCTWLTLFITCNGAWLWWKRRRQPKDKTGSAAAVEAL